MSYHLSRINQEIAKDLFKQIKEGAGFAVFYSSEPARVTYILRAALKTVFKEEWDGLLTLRTKEDRVIVKPIIPLIGEKFQRNIPSSSLRSFLEIASLIVTDSPKLMAFPDANLSEIELQNLKKICDASFYSLTLNPLTVRKH